LAEAFAARLQGERTTPAERIDYAWRLATARAPTAAEKALGMKFLSGEASLKEFALAVFNLNAFLYVN
jgi:hypothetical protein